MNIEKVNLTRDDLYINNEIINKQIAYISKQKLETQESFIRLHIKIKPRWMPFIIYKYLIKNIFCMDMFIKNNLQANQTKDE